MEKRYLLDTNILIYYLNDDIPDHSYNKVKNIIKDSFNISVITKCELLGWNGYTEEDFLGTKKFISNANVVNINNDLVDTTIDIMRKFKLDLADAIIAASAFNNNLILATRNIKDFSRMVNLETYNPFDE